jgi:type II pantothenate kinase
MELVPAGAVDRVHQSIARWNPNSIGITGVNSTLLTAALSSIQCAQINEFTAWALGAPVLAERQGLRLPQHYVLVSIGTGTSILEVKVKGRETKRVSGSTLGGGTLLGLSRLIGCGDSFSEFLTLAARGERSRVDLLVPDAFSSTEEIVLSRGATASSFGKLESKEPADLAQALIWLIGENIGILCNAIARQVAAQTIVFGGGTLAGNQILEQVLRETVTAERGEALFLQDGAFCGAAGAALFTGKYH